MAFWAEKNMRGIFTILVIVFMVFSIALLFTEIKVRRRLQQAAPFKCDTLFVFDPNTITYEELVAMGFERSTAVGILRYRAYGKKFSIPEDFALCHGISDSVFLQLRPYIRIAEKFRPKPKVFETDSVRKPSFDTIGSKPRFSPRPFEPFGIDTVGVKYLRLIGFSTRQAQALINYRDTGGGIFDIDELRDCYAVSEEMADSLAYFVCFPTRDPNKWKVNINTADSMQLCRVRGIGAKTAAAIIEYRRLLGGFYSVNQIAELKWVSPENFDRISQQIYCDSCDISKIDINFAPALCLEQHPYMTRAAIKRITEVQKSKGGWKSVEEMIEDKIFSREQANAIAPYLHFGEQPLDIESTYLESTTSDRCNNMSENQTNE